LESLSDLEQNKKIDEVINSRVELLANRIKNRQDAQSDSGGNLQNHGSK
jgi:hypothetical protein